MKKTIFVGSFVVALFCFTGIAQAATTPIPSTVSLARQIKALQNALAAINLKPGPQGVQGLQGERGASGANGFNGERGSSGSNGERGLTGPAGERGPVGPAGTPGVSADQR